MTISQTDGAWALRGVSAEARAAAREAAEAAGLTLGAWMSQLIRETDVQEQRARQTQGTPLGCVHEIPRLSSIERAMMRTPSFGVA